MHRYRTCYDKCEHVFDQIRGHQAAQKQTNKVNYFFSGKNEEIKTRKSNGRQ